MVLCSYIMGHQAMPPSLQPCSFEGNWTTHPLPCPPHILPGTHWHEHVGNEGEGDRHSRIQSHVRATPAPVKISSCSTFLAQEISAPHLRGALSKPSPTVAKFSKRLYYHDKVSPNLSR